MRLFYKIIIQHRVASRMALIILEYDSEEDDRQKSEHHRKKKRRDKDREEEEEEGEIRKIKIEVKQEKVKKLLK